MTGPHAPIPPDRDDALDALAGEYVLGTLDAQERRAVERRMAVDDALRATVDAWEARLLPLTGLAPLQEPPADLWSRIDRQLDRRAQAQSDPIAAPGAAAVGSTVGGTRRSPWHAWWNSLALWRGLAVAGAAAALLLVLRPAFLEPTGAPAQYVVVLVAPGGQAPGWVVQVHAARDMSLTPIAREPAPADKALQLWTKADDWPAPVSLGLVRAGEPLRLRLDQLPALQPNQLFEITLEPPAGSPTGRPTGPIQYIGRAVRLQS